MEPAITSLLSWLNLDYFSILRLSSLIISLSISVFLFKTKGKSTPTLLLALTFSGATLFNLSMFLESASRYYWQLYSWNHIVAPFLQNLAPSVALVSLLLFAYHLRFQHLFFHRFAERKRPNPVDNVEKIIAEAIAAKDIPDGDPVLLGAMALGIVMQPSVHRTYGRLSDSLSDHIDQFTKSVLAVLRRT